MLQKVSYFHRSEYYSYTRAHGIHVKISGIYKLMSKVISIINSVSTVVNTSESHNYYDTIITESNSGKQPEDDVCKYRQQRISLHVTPRIIFCYEICQCVNSCLSLVYSESNTVWIFTSKVKQSNNDRRCARTECLYV